MLVGFGLQAHAEARPGAYAEDSYLQADSGQVQAGETVPLVWCSQWHSQVSLY